MAVWRWLCLAAMLLGLQARAIEAVTSYTIFYVQDKATYTPYIELYWQINPGSVHMAQQPDSLWSGTVETQVVLRNDTGIIISDAFALQTTPATYNASFAQNIIDLHRYSLPAGKIKMELQFRDKLKPQNTYTYSDSFTVAPATDTTFYSGIQLLDTAYASTAQSIFQKNDKLQIPLCMNFIGDERTKLRFYTELYHANAKHKGILTQNTFISKKALDKAIYGLQTVDTIKAAPVLPFIGSFDISILPSGNYYLNVALYNDKQELVTANSIFFQRSNNVPKKTISETDTTQDTSTFAPIYKVNVFDLGNTFVGKFTVAQLRSVLRMLQPIASANESNSINGFLDNPDQTYMQYFVYNFFKTRYPEDPDKGWEDFANRIKEVNKLFSGSSRGYETDRGQIYLKYGKPNERIIVMNEPGSLPYEIWQYNSPGKQSSQGIFLFYRPPSIINDMILLHATVNGEKRNTQWRQMLFTGSDMQRSNSRAEQYLPFR